MGVYIKEIDMPISCEKCPLCYDYLNCSIDDSLQMYLYNRHPNCPLIEIDLERDIPTIWYNKQTGHYEPKNTKQEVYERLYKMKNGERTSNDTD